MGNANRGPERVIPYEDGELVPHVHCAECGNPIADVELVEQGGRTIAVPRYLAEDPFLRLVPPFPGGAPELKQIVRNVPFCKPCHDRVSAEQREAEALAKSRLVVAGSMPPELKQ